MIESTTVLYIDPGTGATLTGLLGWVTAIVASLAAVMLPFIKSIWRYLKKVFLFLKKHYRFTIPALLIFLLIALFNFTGLFTHTHLIEKKIIILGFDGMNPVLTEKLMKEGRLPAFSRLKSKGAYRRFKTTNPPQSPVAWSAFATGKNGGKSGIFDFIHRNPKTYQSHLSLTKMPGGVPETVLKEPRLWNFLSEKKINSIILGCPDTFPAEKIHGKLISGMGTPDILGSQSTYTFYTTDASKENRENRHAQILNLKTNMKGHIIGPRVKQMGAKAENKNVEVYFKRQDDTVEVRFQNERFRLKKSQWSDWKKVKFSLGFFKSMSGIVKFYLVQAEPELKLYMTPVNIDPANQAFPITYPESYGTELVDKFGLFYTLGMPMDTNALNDGVLDEAPFLSQAAEILKRNKETLFYELEKLKDGVLYQYFESPDIIQHMFWRYTDKEHPMYNEKEAIVYKDTINSWYMALDSIVENVMKQLGPKDELIILSDHGFTTYRTSFHINSWLIKNGYQFLKYGKSKSETLSEIDWSRTRAYAIGFGGIYLNLSGREKYGIVKPGKEAGALVQDLKTRLNKLDNVVKVHTREDLFSGKEKQNSPDLFLGLASGYRASWQTAVGGAPAGIFEPNIKKWSGTHLVEPDLVPGVLFTSFKLTDKNPGLFDITPTVLDLSGFTEQFIKGQAFDGESIIAR